MWHMSLCHLEGSRRNTVEYHNATLGSAADRCLVTCMLYALDTYNQDSGFVRGSDKF